MWVCVVVTIRESEIKRGYSAFGFGLVVWQLFLVPTVMFTFKRAQRTSKDKAGNFFAYCPHMKRSKPMIN